MSHKLIQDALFNAKSVRELDRLAIEEEGIAGIVLMKRAGRAVLQELLELYGAPSLLSVFCGGGNNGGDGYILAALAAEKHIPVQVFELSEELSGDAAIARQYAEQAKVLCTVFDPSLDIVEGVIVDSLLGTGYQGQLRSSYAEAIQIINDSGLPVLAVDIPSGLQADNGAVAELSVQADVTVTFIGAKPGLFSGRGPGVCGEVIYHSLDVPETIFDQVEPDAELMDLAELLDYLPQLDIDAHKTQRGHTMVVGGDRSQEYFRIASSRALKCPVH